MGEAESPDAGVSVIELSDLPLPDHLSGGSGSVADAVRAWNSSIGDAVARDERAQFEAHAQALADEAYLRGVSDGRASAEADIARLLSDLSDVVGDSLRGVDERVEELMVAQAEEMVNGALVIARWVLRREIDRAPDALFDLVASTLREVSGLEGARVCVHPDAGMVAARWASRLGVEGPEVVEDPSLGPGEVLVRLSSGGKGLVSLDSALAQAMSALEGSVSPSSAHLLSEESDYPEGGA